MKVGSVGMPALQAEEVEFIEANSDSTVKAGNSEVVTISPPAGYIYELQGMHLYVATPGSTNSGTHEFHVRSEADTQLGVTRGVSVHSSDLQYNYGYWKTADSIQSPPNDTEQLNHVKGKRIDEDNGINVVYINNTDQDQANERRIRLWVRKLKVA